MNVVIRGMLAGGGAYLIGTTRSQAPAAPAHFGNRSLPWIKEFLVDAN